MPYNLTLCSCNQFCNRMQEIHSSLGGKILDPVLVRLENGLEWVCSQQPVAYPDAIATMEAHVAAMLEGKAKERIWLLEHPPIYTAGNAADAEGLLALSDLRLPVFQSGRGGQYTYHGVGQRVVYVMLNLKARAEAKGSQPDLRGYIQSLEMWGAAALAACLGKNQQSYNICSRPHGAGIWVSRPNPITGVLEDAKIGAIGVRVRRWVTYHGMSLNVNPNLEHYRGIIPCGLSLPVTSLADLGVEGNMQELDFSLQNSFSYVMN